MSWRDREKKSSVLGFLGGTIILFIVFGALLMAWQLTPITAVSKYQHVKSLRWHRQDLVGHFPEKIPRNAKNVVFYYRAGFLQDGAWMEHGRAMCHCPRIAAKKRISIVPSLRTG